MSNRNTGGAKEGAGRPAGVPEIGRKERVVFDTKRRRRFIKKLEQCGVLSEAAASVGVSRNNIYKAMERDPAFKERVEIARERSVANLEKEFEDRIYNGNEKMEYDGDGKLMRRTVTKDNNLLARALEANMPEKYGKKTDSNGGNTIINVGDSAIDKLAAFLKVDLPEREVNNDAIEGDYNRED